MKFMKLGTRPDTFYTENATRTVMSDVESDLTIRVNNTTYLLHKFPLIPKCGLLQSLCSDTTTTTSAVDLHDIPGGEEGFELCAKFCYGITINLGAENLVPALCAAKFLRMNEAAQKGNLATKLEAFFLTCILEGWKDSIVALQATTKLPDWSEDLGIIRKCMDSIVDKILTPIDKVIWSFTYSRPGYDKRLQQFVPRDWWTEDLAILDIDMFRSIITSLRSTNALPPQLIGEAIHVYACQWLPGTQNRPPETSTSSQGEVNSIEMRRRVLETIVSLIPGERGSVSVRFLLRLLSAGTVIGVSPVTKAELIRRSGLRLDEATLNDLLIPVNASGDDDSHFYDVDMVGAVLESFLRQCRRQFTPGEEIRSLKSLRKVARLIDCYLQVISKDANMPVQKIVALAEAVPQIARPDHDELYKAINIYLKEHPDLNKADKKQLCRILDCQKLSSEMRAHAVRNELLPLRTVVQLLYFEQERITKTATSSHPLPLTEEHETRPQLPVPGIDLQRLNLGAGGQSSSNDTTRRSTMQDSSSVVPRKSDQILHRGPESSGRGKEVANSAIKPRGGNVQGGDTGDNLDVKNMTQRKTKSEDRRGNVGG